MTDWTKSIARDDWEEWRMEGSRVLALNFGSTAEAQRFAPGDALFLTNEGDSCIGIAVAHEVLRDRQRTTAIQVRMQLHLALQFDEGIANRHVPHFPPYTHQLSNDVADAWYSQLRHAGHRETYEEATP